MAASKLQAFTDWPKLCGSAASELLCAIWKPYTLDLEKSTIIGTKERIPKSKEPLSLWNGQGGSMGELHAA